jgi:hypothetical protein
MGPERDRRRDRKPVPDVTAGLRWTGHALVDVGIAGACAYAQRQRPEDLTLEDLDRVSAFMVDTYYQAKLGTYLSCVFMNASFVQPNESAAKRVPQRLKDQLAPGAALGLRGAVHLLQELVR